MTAAEVALVGVLAGLAGLAALWGVARLPLPAPARPPRPVAAEETVVALVFDGGHLADATPAGLLLIDAAPPGPDDLSRIVALLSPHLPGLGPRLATLAAGEAASLPFAAPAEALLRVERGRNGLRIVLHDVPGAGVPILATLLAEVAATFRTLADDAPLPIWHETAEGRVVWANRACRAAAGGPAGPDAGPDPASWALPPLLPATSGAAGSQRQRSAAAEGRPARWYDRHDRPAPTGGRSVYALPADEIVRAEAALRGFLQTLTRTFAHLPIGLAVFDADWRLSLFNPALSDLTGLPPTFLARRPTLHAVMDSLRELRMIPEPRDYIAWRRRLADIERAADAGHYTELWSLPSGQTFRVTGQPNAEGGVALLIEDITADTARNRGLRARADLVETALAALDRAVAVFDAGGALVAASTAYRHLWGEDPGDRPAGSDLDAALARWGALCQPTPFWGEMRAAYAPDATMERRATLLLRDGRVLAARAVRLPGGALLADFTLRAAGPTPARPLRSGS